MGLTQVSSKGIKDATLLNEDVNASAAIAMSKLALSITNSEINASAAIAGTKISPNFGSQQVVTTGTLGSSNLTITHAAPTLSFTETNGDPDYKIQSNAGVLKIIDETNSADRLVVNTDGHIDIAGNLDVGAGLDVTGAITGTGDLTIDTNTLHVDSSNNRVGIGTTSPSTLFHTNLAAENGSIAKFGLSGQTNNQSFIIKADDSDSLFTFRFGSSNSTYPAVRFNMGADAEAMRIDSSGNVGIGTGSNAIQANLHVEAAVPVIRMKDSDNNSAVQFVGQDGSIRYDADNDNIAANSHHAFKTDNVERVRIQAEGLSFNGDTAAANALDDYEEGTFTATITAIGGGTSPTFSAQTSSAAYIRVGRIVHCHVYIFDINCTGAGSGIATTIAGFPFASSGHYYPGVITHNTIIGNGNVNTGYLQANNNSPHFIPLIDGQTGAGGTPNTGNPKYIMLAVSYTAQ